MDYNPGFRDAGMRDFHLKSTECGDTENSPCIDTGNPNIEDYLLNCDWGLGTVRSDMGAYGGGDSTFLAIDNDRELPKSFQLLQNYPNPFNASTRIQYSLPERSQVSLEVYNLLGQRVVTLSDNTQQAGSHTIIWDASRYPSGVYFVRLRTLDKDESIKMLLLK